MTNLSRRSFLRSSALIPLISPMVAISRLKENNSTVRALAYNLYENNGVVKRENVSNYLNKLDQEQRKKVQ